MICFLIISASGIDGIRVGHQIPGIEKEETYDFGFKFKNLGNLDGIVKKIKLIKLRN